jgi:hypothetical protein
MTEVAVQHPQVPPEFDAAVIAWMRRHGWQVHPARWEADPELGFYVWQEPEPSEGRSHALWVAEPMVRNLSAEELVGVLNREAVAEEIRISFKVRIQERGDEYRVSVVPRASGGYRRPDQGEN